MFNIKEPPIVISVGGSLMAPGITIATDFLIKLNHLIREQVSKGKRFFLVAGGGKISRLYIDAGKTIIGDVADEDLDWLAIHITRVNAHLLRTIFQDIAHPRIIENYDKRLRNWKEPVVIGAGWKPGWSTDYDATILARDYNANIIINLSNIDYVYDKDPIKFKDAKPIKKTTWEEVEKLVGKKFSPGLSAPFDPIATRLAKEIGLTVIVTSGHDFTNLKRIIEGESFNGTVITPFDINAGFYNHDYYAGKKGGHRLSYTESFVGQLFHSMIAFYRALVIRMMMNPKTCLDVGCGTGRLVGWLRKFGIDARGVDISKYAIELSDKSVKPYLTIGDASNLPFKDNQFEVVITYDILERIERSKIKKVIEETVRVSNKYILHKIYTYENVWFSLFHRRDYSIISFFSQKYWKKLFSSLDKVKIIKNKIRIPTFIETKFILKKTS